MSQSIRGQYDTEYDKQIFRNVETPKMESSFSHSSLMKISPADFRTPVRMKRLEDIREESEDENNFGSQPAPFMFLPSHSTPPQQKRVQNPFDAALIKRLHLPVVSPSIFRRVVSPTQETCDFSWTIDDVAKLRPAPIEETIPEQYEFTDPELELKAQEAINNYFCNMPMVVSSPWGSNTICIEPKTSKSPCTSENSDNEKDAYKEADVLSASSPAQSSSPERVSKPAICPAQDINDSVEEANLSTSTLRRKLFCQEDGGTEDVLPLSSFSMQLECTKESPLRSGVLFNSSKIVCPSTPITKDQRFGTPLTKSKEMFGSPEVSPIRSLVLDSKNLLVEKTKLPSPCSSSLGASPLKCYEGTVSMVQQWESEDTSMASLHASYSAMVTSETPPSAKGSSGDRLLCLENVDFQYLKKKIENNSEDSNEIMNLTNYQRNCANNGNHTAFSSTPIKKVYQDRLFCMENIDLSHFRKPSKITNGDQSDEEEMLSLNSQDTGYQTGYINSGAVSAFSSLNNWSSVQQPDAPLTSDNCEKLLYSISKTTTVEESNLWNPNCMYIISSTPTKASNS